MFNVGGGELLVIMLIALIVLGPQRLPDAARQVGKVMGEVRRVSSGFQREMRDAFDTSEAATTPRRRESTPLAATVAEADEQAAPPRPSAAADRTVAPAGKRIDASGPAQPTPETPEAPEAPEATETTETTEPTETPEVTDESDPETPEATDESDGARAALGGGAAVPASGAGSGDAPDVTPPVAAALDEIVTPLDDERAAS